MNTLEQWILRIVDQDWNWVGLNWMRPAKRSQIGIGFVLFSSFVMGLPGMVVYPGLLYLIFGKVDLKLWLLLVILVMLAGLALNGLFARAWNRRARRFAEMQTPA